VKYETHRVYSLVCVREVNSVLVGDARWAAGETEGLCLCTKQQQRVLPKLCCQSALDLPRR